jgi:hypothetical protein
LFDLCASAEEVKVVLNEKCPDDRGKDEKRSEEKPSDGQGCTLARVKLAIKTEQKRVI